MFSCICIQFCHFKDSVRTTARLRIRFNPFVAADRAPFFNAFFLRFPQRIAYVSFTYISSFPLPLFLQINAKRIIGAFDTDTGESIAEPHEPISSRNEENIQILHTQKLSHGQHHPFSDNFFEPNFTSQLSLHSLLVVVDGHCCSPRTARARRGTGTALPAPPAAATSTVVQPSSQHPRQPQSPPRWRWCAPSSRTTVNSSFLCRFFLSDYR